VFFQITQPGNHPSFQTAQTKTDNIFSFSPLQPLAPVTAACAVANIVKSSLGPVGLDKMLVDQIGDVTITNDGATILKQLEVEHPAAKVLVELSDLQDQEVGDGTTSVVIIAAELLKRANQLVKHKIHPTSVISGYRLAMRESVKYIKKNLTIAADTLGRENLLNAARTSMSSKIIGTDSDFFAEMVVKAVTSVRHVRKNGKVVYPVRAINILKAHGRSAAESHLVDGFALNHIRSAQGMPKSVQNAKIAFLDFNLNKHRIQMGVQVLINTPGEIEKVVQREMDICKERINKMFAAGVIVVLTTKAIDDMALKYFVEAGAIGIRRVNLGDMRRLAKATGGRVLMTLSDMEGEEEFDPTGTLLLVLLCCCVVGRLVGWLVGAGSLLKQWSTTPLIFNFYFFPPFVQRSARHAKWWKKKWVTGN
jgi:T-complex protein 1 subunit alpha